MTDKKVKLSWSAPVNADGSVYEHLNEYHIHHNVPGTQSPVVVPGGTTTTEETLGAGKYQVGIQTVSNEGFKSSKVITSFEVKDPALREVPRHYGIPVGGVISTNSLITSLGVFKTEETTGWSVATAGAPLHIHSFSTGSADRYSQDCDSIASLTFTGMGVDEGHIKSHYLLFDASNSSDPLRLIKYEDTVFSTSNNLNIGYWYDTGDGDTTPESTFVTKTGTVTVGLGASEVVGSGTAFLSEYEIDDIIYFSSTQAAKVTYVSSNTSLTIDRDFTTAISGAIKKQGLTFDTNYDAILYQIRKDAGTFKITPALLIVDTSIYSRSRIAILQAAPTLLNFNATPTLTTTYTNLVLTATASGYTKPKFKITGAGFDNSEISQTADTSFQNPTSGRTYVRTLDKVDVFVATDLDFTVTITEESDEDNTDLQNSQTVTIPFLKDGSGSGSTGVDAKVVQLTVDDYSIIYDKDGLNPSPSGNMTLTASSQNFTDPYFKFTGDGINDETSYTDGTDASDTFTFAIPTSHFTDPKSLRVGVAESTAATAELSFDSISITAVKPGATGVRGIDGMTFICTNEAHVFNASETGVVGSYANSGTRIEVYEGGTELVYDAVGTSNSTWKTTEAATNITVGTKTDSGNYLTVGNHSGVANGTNDSTIIYTITGKRADGTAFTTTVQQSFTKSTKGDTGTTGLQGVSGVDGVDGAGIEYIFAVTADSSTTPSAPTNSWGFDQPNSPWFDGAPSMTTSNKALWRAQRAILGNPSVGDSVSANWSGSTVVGRFGDDGVDGVDGVDGATGATGATGAVGKKTATGYLYYNTQQANAPSAPSNSSVTYYFSNGTMGGGVVSSGAWSLTAPTATTGTSGSKMYYIYWNATETTAGGGTASPGFGSTVYTATNFTGLVRFNGTNKIEDGLGSELSFGSSGTTTIDGAKITTGTIDAARLNVGSISISGFYNDSGFTNDAAANTAQTTANSANTTANSASTAASNAQTTADGKTTLAAANAAVNANVTSISGGVIQTGTLIAAKIESGNNAIGSSSNKFAFNGDTEYGISGISTVIGATAVNSSTAAALFFSSGGTTALGVQTNTSGISAGLFFNSSSIGTETYRNRADLANDSYGSVFTDDSGKYAKLATPTEAGWFQDAAATPNYVKIATGTHALYYAGAVGTFTAGHDALLTDSESCEVGDILVDQGVAYASSVSDVITNVTRSTSANQKAVIGVFVQENPDHIPVPLAKEIITDIGSGPSAGVSRTHIIDPAHDSIVANKTIIAMNSVGEGQVNVCGESGDIEIGDLISSSSTTGKGMKQADDIVRSCTVGKAREAVTFATAGTVKQIACIYMCG